MAVSDRPVLELRVHGVSNTPPQNMLDVSADSITEYGDELGGFWSLKGGVVDGLSPSKRGWVPPRITREAYSWGALARTSVAAPGFAAKVVSVASRAGWILLMPFGIANVAFWSRLPKPGQGSVRNRVSGHEVMRLFALVLTLIFTMTLVTVFIDIIAIQCLSSKTSCSVLPSWLDIARTWPEGRRVVAALAVVLLVLFGLSRLSVATNVRYEIASVQPVREGFTTLTATDAPMLADRGFWARPNSKRRLLTLHVELATAAIVLMVAADWNFRGSFAAPGSSWSSLPGWTRVLWWIAAVLAVVVVVYVVAYSLRRGKSSILVQDGPDAGAMHETDRPSPWMIPVVLISLGCAVAALWLRTPAETARVATEPSVMLSTGPALFGGVAAGLVLAGWAWTLRTVAAPRSMLVRRFGGLVVFVGILVLGWRAGTTPALVAAGLLCVAVGAEHLRAQRTAAPQYGFAGRAAAVFMLLSLGFAVLLTSAATLATGDWVNDCYAASDLTPRHHDSALPTTCPSADGSAAAAAPEVGVKATCTLTPTSSDTQPPATTTPGVGSAATCTGTVTAAEASTAAHITAPAVFQLAAALILPTLVLAMLVVAAWAVRYWWQPRPPAVRWAPPGSSPDDYRDLMKGSRSATRRFASYTARAEALVTVGAAAILVNLVLAVALASAAEFNIESQPEWMFGPLSVGTAATAVLVLALVGLLLAGTSASNTRPLGLIWDLVCFLPRDGHPLAPPCYAERAVPELTGRVLSWLDANDVEDEGVRSGAAADRRVILSGHSLGGVLCVAAIMQLDEQRWDRLSLMTYGSQLQAYFSRIFPVLLGPEVLGVPGMPALKFWASTPVPAHDPTFGWSAQSVRVRLGGRETPTGVDPRAHDEVRWRNLWRATDPIGFPVDGGRWVSSPPLLGPVDYGCDEIDATGYMASVGGHSDYPRTPQYVALLENLRDQEPPPVPSAPRLPGTTAVAGVVAGAAVINRLLGGGR